MTAKIVSFDYIFHLQAECSKVRYRSDTKPHFCASITHPDKLSRSFLCNIFCDNYSEVSIDTNPVLND